LISKTVSRNEQQSQKKFVGASGVLVWCGTAARFLIFLVAAGYTHVLVMMWPLAACTIVANELVDVLVE
jgi:hypothetical protein